MGDINCALVFAIKDKQQEKVLSVIDASSMNSRFHEAVYGTMSFSCSPSSEWGDINQNGKPDIPIAFWWAGGITGSELHIFEVNENLTVTDITANLPGIMSPFFDMPPASKVFTVYNISMVSHDCIYPPITISRNFEWRGGLAVDVTPEREFLKNVETTKNIIAAHFGMPLNDRDISHLTEVLISYDLDGQRENGWQEYQFLADVKNWPGSSEDMLKWLRSDVEHFKAEYLAKKPFTPNNYCPKRY